MPDPDMSGKFTIEIASLPDDPDNGDSEMYPSDAMVTVTATDPEGLWTSQEIAVRRNRAPRNRTSDTDSTEIVANVAAIHLGITSMSSKRLHAPTDLFIDDAGDKLTLTPRVTDPAAVMAEVDDRGDYVTLKALKVTGLIAVRFSVVDSGMLSAPDEAEIMVQVHDGPKIMDGSLDVRRPLGDETAVIPVSAFIKSVTDQTTTYTASSKNSLVANATIGSGTISTPGGGFTTGEDGTQLQLAMKSLGTTEITLKAMQAEVDPAPAQELTVKFMLTVE